MFFEFIYIPQATPTIQSINNYASPWMQGLLPIMYVEAGLIIGAMAIAGIIGYIIYLFTKKHPDESHSGVFDLSGHNDGGWVLKKINSPKGKKYD